MDGKRILVASGDAGAREQARERLVRSGFSVCVVESGPELHDLAGREPGFDLILLDRDSLALAPTEFEAVPAFQAGALVLVIGCEPGVSGSPGFGAAEYLREPLASAELPRLLAPILERRELRAENAALRASTRAFEQTRVLATCVDASDVLTLGLEILLDLLDGGGAVGRLQLVGPEAGEELCLRGFAPQLARTLRQQAERGKLFSLEPGESEVEGRRAALQREWLRMGLGAAEVLEFWVGEPAGTAGAVWILREGRPFSVAERRVARVVASQMQLALGTTSRFAEIRERAFLDDVTSLHNVRYLFWALRREIERARRSSLDLSVLFLDLDHFKRVNDSHGHLVGSAVLREFGDLLKQWVRSIDTVGRYGGDEFAMVLVDTSLEAARGVAERIRQHVEARRFGAGSGLSCRITVSIGAASFPGHGTRAEVLVDRADRAMYRAKALGRNQVCSAETSEPPA